MYTSGNCTLITGSRLIAQKEGTELRYIHQDHLSGTSLMTSANGTSLGVMKYDPFGTTRSGDVPTDRLFTGQRSDDTGLYYYNARYYDPELGRFISADTIVPDPMSSQAYNRYSYCLNNPLKYVDPSGNIVMIHGFDVRELDFIYNNPDMLRAYPSSDPALTDALVIALASDEYKAYSEYKNSSDERKLAARTMEKTTNFILNINTKELRDLEYIREKSGKVFTLSIDPDTYTILGYYNLSYPREIIDDYVRGEILDMDPSFAEGERCIREKVALEMASRLLGWPLTAFSLADSVFYGRIDEEWITYFPWYWILEIMDISELYDEIYQSALDNDGYSEK